MKVIGEKSHNLMTLFCSSFECLLLITAKTEREPEKTWITLTIAVSGFMAMGNVMYSCKK